MSGVVRGSKLRDNKIHLSFNSEESFNQLKPPTVEDRR
jgi:hypothetical protein